MLLRLFGIRWPRTPRVYWITAAVWIVLAVIWALIAATWAAIVSVAMAALYSLAAIKLTYRRSARGRIDRLLRPPPEVTIDKDGVRLAFADGSTTALAWGEIRIVVIVSRRLRVGRDLFIVFWGPGDKALPILYDRLPLNLLEEIHRLPGFDIDSPSQAIRSLQGRSGQFPLWRRAL